MAYNIDYNKRAVDLAKELLGKIIEYNNIRYMITVTEAYPYDETDNKTGKIKSISYVNRSSNGKGHDELTGEDKIGNCFIYGHMIHIACKGGPSKLWGNEYSCDNVLIRGAIEVDGKSINNGNDRLNRLNYKIGSPYTLGSTIFKIPKDQPALSLVDNKQIIKVYDFKSFDEKDSDVETRYNLTDDEKYRYFLIKDVLKEIINKA